MSDPAPDLIDDLSPTLLCVLQSSHVLLGHLPADRVEVGHCQLLRQVRMGVEVDDVRQRVEVIERHPCFEMRAVVRIGEIGCAAWQGTASTAVPPQLLESLAVALEPQEEFSRRNELRDVQPV